jgi:hypothetical protein
MEDRWLEPIFLHRELYKPDHSDRTDAGDKQLGKRTDPVGFAFGRPNLPANLECPYGVGFTCCRLPR